MKVKEIVVVEDNHDIRELIGIILHTNKYSLKLLENADMFNRHMEQHQPDVIVLDVMLPDGNGIDICRKLKENPATENIPVVLMSANKDIRSGNTGAAAFIDKPFDIDEFKQKVEHYI